MKKALKYLGLVAGSLLVIVVIAGVVLFLIGNSRLNKEYDFPASEIILPTDEASLANGKHRVESLCQGCHGEDLGGIVNFFDGGPLGTLDSANLTAGAGGIGSDYTTEDYVRAVRHGIGKDGKPIFMPAVVSTAYFSDEDLGAIIAYLKTVPPVDRQLNGERFSPLAKILLALGKLGELPVESVSHNIHVTAPERGATVEYGEYIVNTYDCRICHGQTLNGGRHADPTIQRISPNLTPGGELAFWTEEDFINTIRTGVTPGGHPLDPELMPWQEYAKLHDDELRAVWLYLQSLPELPQYTE
ncbi:MAG TPA: c-type cytochrome [Anaerolineales bacterium]|nr:c-type cytochrome [Anaerolineales bacterium]